MKKVFVALDLEFFLKFIWSRDYGTISAYQAIFIRLFFSHFVLRLKSNKIQIQRFMSLSNDSKMLWRSLWGMQFDLE